MDQEINIIDELKNMNKKLKTYQRYIANSEKLTETQKRYRDRLKEELTRRISSQKELIIELTQMQYASRFGHKFDVWREAFNTTSFSNDYASLTLCIQAINEAIGILESKEKNTATIGTVSQLSPIQLFDAMRFHQTVIDSSKELFEDGHYRDAIYRAFVEVNNFVKRKSKSSRDGKALMSTVFSPNSPIIKLNSLETQSARDEQEGFMHLFIGAMQGIRNPKAHENILQNDPYIALELMGLASLLIKTIDFWRVDDDS